MPKGDKSKKNGSSREVKEKAKGPLLLSKDVEGTVYGQVTKALGDCNFKVFCFDSTERLCHLRGALVKNKSKQNRIETDTIVLVGLRDFQNEKGDIIYVYTKEQVAELKNMKEIPSKIVNESSHDVDDNDDIVFDDTVFDEI